MTDHKFDRDTDRHATLLDFKQRLIDLMENQQQPPDVEWDAEPLRYYKLNKRWAAIVFGWLDWLEDVAGWAEAEDEAFAGIQAILKFEEGIELPDPGDFDCGDVEDCLESSEIINNLEEQIVELTNQIKELEDEQATDTTDLPDTPDMGSAGNSVCRGADFIARRLGDLLLDMWDKAKTLTLQEFMSAIGSILSWGFIPATEFWQYVFTLSNPDLANECQDYLENIRQAFFCANWELETALTYIQDDPDLPSDVKALWITFIDNFRQSQIDEFGQIGTLGEEEFDCTDGCPFVIVWDFGGNYVPLGDEDNIFNGNSWDVAGGIFDEGNGYVAHEDVMVVSHPLPEQCSVHSMVISVHKGNTCLKSDNSVWWRGTSGTDAEQYSPEAADITNVYHSQTFTMLGNPIMSQLKVKMDAFFCSVPGEFNQSIEWVRIVGTGNKPVE